MDRLTAGCAGTGREAGAGAVGRAQAPPQPLSSPFLGVKWSATKWIHVTQFYPPGETPPLDPDACADASEHCAAWAAAGECAKNKAYMLASCRAACGTCPPPVPPVA